MNTPLKKHLFSSQINLAKFSPASEDEKSQQEVMSESTTFFKDGMKKLMRNPLAVGAIIVLVLLIITIIVAPMVIPYGYDEILKVDGKRDKTAANLAPFTWSENEQRYMEETGEQLFPHIFGTDKLCRDYFARVIYGTRVSLSVGLFASILVMRPEVIVLDEPTSQLDPAGSEEVFRAVEKLAKYYRDNSDKIDQSLLKFDK